MAPSGSISDRSVPREAMLRSYEKVDLLVSDGMVTKVLPSAFRSKGSKKSVRGNRQPESSQKGDPGRSKRHQKSTKRAPRKNPGRPKGDPKGFWGDST